MSVKAMKKLLTKGYEVGAGDITIHPQEDGSYLVRSRAEDETFKKPGKAIKRFMEKRRKSSAAEKQVAVKRAAPKKKSGKKKN